VGVEEIMTTAKPRPTLYLSGPMTGIAEYNYPLFIDTAARLRNLGYPVYSPSDYGLTSEDWVACMRRNITDLMKCDEVALLRGWERSNGSVREVTIADWLKMPVRRVEWYLKEELSR
jgi:Domain of unknown function (DUF4406)